MQKSTERFDPADHFRTLKGQQYLDVKFRVVWFREDHPEGCVNTELVEHDADAGLAVFRARASYMLADGREVYATGYGSETRADFAAYLEKGETKAVGRALAMLGYGTAQAMELDEGTVVDSPVERRSAPREETAGVRGTLREVQRDAVPATELREQVVTALAHDAEAREKLPKDAAEMSEEELAKTLAWLVRRARVGARVS